jgi:hypothetical protein
VGRIGNNRRFPFQRKPVEQWIGRQYGDRLARQVTSETVDRRAH